MGRDRFAARPHVPSSRRVVAGLLFGGAFVLYAASVFGVVTGNDGAHFATARALARNRSFAVGEGRLMALTDVTRSPEGEFYSNKPPGVAIIVAPFYLLAEAFSTSFQHAIPPAEVRWHQMIAEHFGDSLGFPLTGEAIVRLMESELSQQYVASLAASCAGVIVLILVFLLCRELGASVTASLWAVLLTALGTLLWRYSSSLFAHVFAAGLVAGLMLLLVRRARGSNGRGWLFGLLIGFGPWVELQALFTAPLLLWWWYRTSRRPDFPSRLREAIVPLAVAGATAGSLLVYQWITFGSPWVTSYANSPTMTYAHSVTTLFAANPIRGAYLFLFSPWIWSLFSTSPFLLAGIVGLVAWPRNRAQWRGRFVAFGVATVGILAFMVHPWGGLTLDHRYVLRMLPVLIPPVAFAIDEISRWPRTRRATALAVFGLLAMTSVWRALGAQALFGKHAALLAGFETPGLMPSVFDPNVLKAVFPGVASMPWVSLILVLGVVVGWVAVTAVGDQLANGWHAPGNHETSAITSHADANRPSESVDVRLGGTE